MQPQRHVATAIFLRERCYHWDVPVGMMPDQWSIAVAYAKGEAGKRLGDTLFAPTNGSDVFGLAVTYHEGPMKITTGVSYGKLYHQDVTASPEVDVTLRDVSVVGLGLRLGYTF